MNEFTKEELIYIRNHIFSGAAAIRMLEHDALRDKIQSMIDNYCDHSHGTTSNSEVDYVLSCSECNAFKGWC